MPSPEHAPIGFDLESHRNPSLMEGVILSNETLVKTHRVIVQLRDSDCLTTLINPTLAKTLDISPEELEVNPFLLNTFIHPDDLETIRQVEEAFTQTGSPVDIEYRLVTEKDVVWVREITSVVNDNAGNPIFVLTIMEDITNIKLVEEELYEALKKYLACEEGLVTQESLVQRMPEGYLIEDKDGNIVRVNSALLKMLGYNESQLIGKHWKEIVAEESIEIAAEHSRLRPQGVADIYELQLKTRDGRQIAVRVAATPIFQDGFAGTAVLIHDITELYDQILKDPLTELWNRRKLNEFLTNEIARAIHYGHNCCVLRLDIDNFRQFNELALHEGGDQALKDLAQALKSNVKELDLPVRLGEGSDEFVVVLIEVDKDKAIQIAQRIKNAVLKCSTVIAKKSGTINGGVEITVGNIIPISASVGGASLEEIRDVHRERAIGTADVSQRKSLNEELVAIYIKTILELADKRLYKAKEKKGSVVFDHEDSPTVPGSV